VAYFAALLARTEDGWDVSETELDDVETLADLADLAREAAADEETVLVFIEQEDVWFAVVRVDGEEDPRIFVSDASSASRSAYGEIILTDELLGRGSGEDLDDLVAELDEDTEEDEDDEDAAVDSVDGVPNGPLGDAGLLIEFGVGAKELMDMSVEGAVPGDALTEIADALGCGEVLEAVR
jgi:putative tRNA adenosine deaminase-associated protein